MPFRKSADTYDALPIYPDVIKVVVRFVEHNMPPEQC